MLTLPGMRIEGIATCVPRAIRSNEDLAETFGAKAMSRFGKSTGILNRRVSTGESSLDLCLAAAEKLFAEGCERASIDGVIFVSQTPDFILPASAAIAQHRLGLRTDIIAFDINLGCSGYVYGLLTAAQFLSQRSGRFLLLAGDTITRVCDSEDRATFPIFGDAGSATLIGSGGDGPASDLHFAVGTDGSGAGAIVVPGSGFASQCLAPVEGVIDGKLFMDGGSVFSFATTRVPELISGGLDKLGWNPVDVDSLVLHQANSLILSTIARKVGVAPERVFDSLADYGNTSCASIPVALADHADGAFGRTVLCGFGVGLSWAAMFADLGEIRTFQTEYSG